MKSGSARVRIWITFLFWISVTRLHAAELRIWVLPAERGLDTDVTDVRELEAMMDRFQHSMVPPGVIVENLADPVLRAQLLAWNPEFAMPNFGWLRGQIATLNALGRFSRDHNVRVRVRFNTWTNAFTELDSAAKDHQLPDVAQIGSTWTKRFQDQGLLYGCEGGARDDHQRNFPGAPCASRRYLWDVRLIFFWQRPPSSTTATNSFFIDGSSWKALVDSLQTSRVPPFAMPIGLTFNVMHDLFPLANQDPDQVFHFRHWPQRADLTGEDHLNTLKLLSTSAVFPDQQGFPRRIIAFPEVTHEEAIRSFEIGGYVGIIEPVGYLTRWRDNYQQLNPNEDFWQFAGVAAPPASILGGSDLAVFKGSPNPTQAEQLSAFLTSDADYIRMLAQLGNLPAHDTDSAIDILAAASAGTDRVDVVRQLAREIRLSWHRSREYPPLGLWPTEVESRPVLEATQRVWRRIAEGDPSKVESSAGELQQLINSRIDPLTIAADRITSLWREVSLVLVLVMVALWWSNRKRAALLEFVRKVRGFSSAALATLDCAHYRSNPFPGDPKDRDKAALIAAGLLGLRRGLDAKSWEPEPISRVVWRSIVLALDSVYDASLSRRFLEQAFSPELFLSRGLLLRPSPGFASGDPPFYFEFDIAADPKVALPFMLEQALTCILQNALKACKMESSPEGVYFPRVLIHIGSSGVTISNEANTEKPFSPRVSDLINSGCSIEEFDARVQELLQGPAEHRPGIGLVETYCIASLCYSGLRLAVEGQLVSVAIKLSRRGLTLRQHARNSAAWVFRGFRKERPSHA